MDEKIVAVAFLTAGDLTHLGAGFRRHFPLPEGGGDFADLLAELDKVDPLCEKRAEYHPNG